MRQHTEVALGCMLVGLCAVSWAHPAEGENAFGDWTVKPFSPTSVVARTHGTKVYGHTFGIVASIQDCGSPNFWITWSAQGADKPKLEQFRYDELVHVSISAGESTSRIELPLLTASPLTANITVFALANVPVPNDLLEVLGQTNEVEVTIEKPQWLARSILDTTDSFMLDGFGPASLELAQQCTALASASSTCPGADLSISTWVQLGGEPAASRTEYLAKLESCVSKKPALADEVDYSAVEALYALDAMPEESRARLAAFIGDVLRLNAKVGNASSQHNLAAMYNARPGSTVASVFKQDYGSFLYWTRMAAAQEEPRALFNLANRLAADDASGSVESDPATAYLVFLVLRPLMGQNPGLAELRPIVDNMMQELENKLGDEQVAELKKGAGSFKLSLLAPTGAEPAVGLR